MKIRFLLGDASGAGGAIRTTLTMAEALAERGHDVEVASVIHRWPRPAFPLSPQVRLVVLTRRQRVFARGWRNPRRLARRLLQAGLGRIPSRLVPRGDKLYGRVSLWTDLVLLRYFRRQHGGVLIGTNPALNRLVGRFAPPDVVSVGEEHLNLRRRRPAVRPLLQQGYRRLDALVTLTEGDAADYQAFLGSGVHVAAVPNAVPALGVVEPAPLTAPIAVAGGRMKRQKGFDLLIRAWQPVAAAHPDWRLHLYGRGPERGALKALVKELDLTAQVRLPGFTPVLPRKMAASSLYVLSSRYEGFPMVMLEAMECGVPVVAFDCPTGPSELIEDGVNGRLVPAGAVRELSAAILQVIEDPELRTRMGAAARETASRYSREAVAGRWEELLQLLVEQKRLAGGSGPSRTSALARARAAVDALRSSRSS